MDALDVSMYPNSIMAYPDGLLRTPLAKTAQGVGEVTAPYAVPPVPSAITGPGGGQSYPSRDGRRSNRLRPYTPPRADVPYALSFDNVLARYRQN